MSFSQNSPSVSPAADGYVTLLNEPFYKIQHFDRLEPFFISLVSSFDHWLFISSSGGLSAGRVNADRALFPYVTEDKIAENNENTGAKTLLRLTRGGQTWLWEPFSIRQQGQYNLERNLYKNIPGTALVFEEINHSLGLAFRYSWRTSERFGFVKTAWLENQAAAVEVDLLDGLQNILPANVSAATQSNLSCLLDAYKRSELDAETGLGIFALNSTLTDLAEPSESLLATGVFQVGLKAAAYLLCSRQLRGFRAGEEILPEQEVRGRRGAFFVHSRFSLAAQTGLTWHIVADVNQDAAALTATRRALRQDSDLAAAIEADIALNTARLRQIVAQADGLQVSANELCVSHHFSNVMFNLMRGGIFANGYAIEKTDLLEFIAVHQPALLSAAADFFDSLPSHVTLMELRQRAAGLSNPDLKRMLYTYLPLTFSRRHGDPSRPWNRFSINLKKADGSQRLDYEGNWRDIFQNWEALAWSYPEYAPGMIFTFLSATTADGYNPYRITRAGVDWETPDPGNPWANIGYWSDHQIIYLQKLLEISEKTQPGALRQWFNQPVFSYASVPYRIKAYADLLADPYNTIEFDEALHQRLESLTQERGSDAKLLTGADGKTLHRSLTEKLLGLLLAKLVNFVPEGGIWMNTQRPEWNDANNALVGKGLSVVTLGYLRRFVVFFRSLLAAECPDSFSLGVETVQLFARILATLEQFQPLLTKTFSAETRRQMMDALGQAGSDYRAQLYQRGFSGALQNLPAANLLRFLELTQNYIEHSLRANRRSDALYHAYNTLTLTNGRAVIARLPEMLEGQVAILSSGLLTAAEALELLTSLRASALYRPDQRAYILYPDKTLPGFLTKNRIPAETLRGLRLPAALTAARESSLLIQDVEGDYHFAGGLRNARDLSKVLETLSQTPDFAPLVAAESESIFELFENVFHHSQFTGRSGTFFGYEGLGSVYWHMVSKLLLASQETALRFQQDSSAPGLRAAYREIRAGLSFNKTPQEYGAFPTDPYSHTPQGQGARQPGMTGMVKEEILARQAELGWQVENGQLTFSAWLFDAAEGLSSPSVYEYWDVNGKQEQISIPAGSVAFSICQVPVILRLTGQPGIQIHFSDGSLRQERGLTLDAAATRQIFRREAAIHHLEVTLAV